MALPQSISSVGTLVGALRVNYALPAPASFEDPGGKLQLLVSNFNQLAAQISYIQTLISSTFASGITFSGLSTTTFSGTPGGLSNFNAS